MKRRTLLTVTALVAAFTLLAVTAFASAPEYEGYEAFKDLAKRDFDEEKEHKNATMNGTFTVIDNGVTVANVEASFKAEDGKELASGTMNITSDDESKSMDIYVDGDKAYFYDKDNDQFYLADKAKMDDDMYGDMYDEAHYKDFEGREKWDKEEMTPQQEELLDFLAGDLKDDFELSNNADGSQTITFELTKDEIPMLLNLAVSVMDGHKQEQMAMETMPSAELIAKYPILEDMMQFKSDRPELTSNIELDYVKLSVTTSGDEFVGADFNFKVSGDDEAGTAHVVELMGSFGISDLGTTVVDTPELEGKDIIEVDPADFEEYKELHGGHKGVGFKGRR